MKRRWWIVGYSGVYATIHYPLPGCPAARTMLTKVTARAYHEGMRRVTPQGWWRPVEGRLPD